MSTISLIKLVYFFYQSFQFCKVVLVEKIEWNMNIAREREAKIIMTEDRQCFSITGIIFFFQSEKKNMSETVQEKATL